MSRYHVIGITNDGRLEQIHSFDDEDMVDETAMRWKSAYRQMFLISTNFNAQELIVTLPVEGRVRRGDYAPSVGVHAGEGRG